LSKFDDGSLRSHYCSSFQFILNDTGRQPIIARHHTTVTVMSWTIDDGPLHLNLITVPSSRRLLV